MAAKGSTLAQKVSRLARDPGLAREYAGWLLSAATTGGKPRRRLLGGIEIGSFADFSEYHSVPRFINDEERAFFEKTPFGEGTIIDVGANVGLVSLLLARRFPTCDIHAFEPNPTTYDALVANIALNHADRVTCHRLAVSDAVGTVRFDNDPVKRGTASIALRDGAHTAEVPATTLDGFVAEHGITRIGLLKIDVEGFETLVLAGARRVLADIRPAAIYFEVCPVLTERSGFSADGPARTIQAAGYDLFRLTDGGALVPAQPEDTAGIGLENWLARPA